MRSSNVLVGVTFCSLLASGLMFEVCAAAQTGPSSGADTDTTSARSSFDEGLKQFRLGDFDAAIAAFEAAFRTKPHPSVLFNLGRAYAAAGRPVEAVRTLEQYLAETAPTLSVHRRATVNALLAAQERRVSTITVTASEPGVDISVDGVPVGETPLKGPVSVAPGSHAVTGTRDGFIPTVVAVSLGPSEGRELELALEPLPIPVPAPAVVMRPSTVTRSSTLTQPLAPRPPTIKPDPSGASTPRLQTLRRVGVASLGVGAVSSVLGSYFAIRAYNSWSERNRHCGTGACDAEAVEAWRDAKRYSLAADVSLALGLASAGVGVYMLVAQHRESSTATSLNVSTNGSRCVIQLQGPL